MKIFFSFCKIFSLFLFSFYIFSSCKSSLSASGNSEEKKRAIISIVGSDNTGELNMVDEKGDSARNFVAWSGQIIKWKIRDKSVKAFDSLPPKGGNLYSIFKREPRKKFLSKTWKAKLAKTEIKDDQKYYYNIDWTDKGGHHHRFDPLIQVKPRQR